MTKAIDELEDQMKETFNTLYSIKTEREQLINKELMTRAQTMCDTFFSVESRTPADLEKLLDSLKEGIRLTRAKGDRMDLRVIEKGLI